MQKEKLIRIQTCPNLAVNTLQALVDEKNSLIIAATGVTRESYTSSLKSQSILQGPP